LLAAGVAPAVRENCTRSLLPMRKHALTALLLAGLVAVAAWGRGPGETAAAKQPAAGPAKRFAKATFAGGCFWCMEHPFDELPGVVSTTSGYTGGQKKNPTYEEVSAGGTGHAESVQVVYDPAKVSYQKLLDVYWRNIDPLAQNHQFCDYGRQYRSAIFYHDETQHRLAEASKRALEKQERFRGKIATEIVPASAFWPAEEYHQDYYRKNPLRYRFYRTGCGRDARLAELWGASE
jgi:peptide-methionine (S)-S-oxide reductase